jgi:HAMP domain-containing protein
LSHSDNSQSKRSIRVTFRLAIAGVTVLSIFQVVLTLYYLHEINVSADAIATATSYSVEVNDSRVGEQGRKRAAESIRNESNYIEQVLGHANRNLVTLLLLTVVYLLVLLIILPRQILEPIKRLARLIRRVEPQQLIAYAQSGAGDELSELAGNLHETLERRRRFDANKSEQIVNDQAKLSKLMGVIDHPVAIITRDYLIELANPALGEFLGMKELSDEVRFPQLFSQGGTALRKLIDSALNQRQDVDSLPIQLSGAMGDCRAHVTIKAIRARGGPANTALIIFETD